MSDELSMWGHPARLILTVDGEDIEISRRVIAEGNAGEDRITPAMIERAARALSDQTQGGHGNHWCAEWQKPDTPGVCGLCWDHAKAVLNAALTETAIVEKEL